MGIPVCTAVVAEGECSCAAERAKADEEEEREFLRRMQRVQRRHEQFLTACRDVYEDYVELMNVDDKWYRIHNKVITQSVPTPTILLLSLAHDYITVQLQLEIIAGVDLARALVEDEYYCYRMEKLAAMLCYDFGDMDE